MEKPVVDVRHFLETALKEEVIELLMYLKNLNRPALNGFVNALEKNI